MTRISRTAALSAAAVLALGIAACSPPHQKNSDAPQVTTVSPASGYAGAGAPHSSAAAAESAAADAGYAGTLGQDTTATTAEPAAR